MSVVSCFLQFLFASSSYSKKSLVIALIAWAGCSCLYTYKFHWKLLRNAAFPSS